MTSLSVRNNEEKKSGVGAAREATGMSLRARTDVLWRYAELKCKLLPTALKFSHPTRRQPARACYDASMNPTLTAPAPSTRPATAFPEKNYGAIIFDCDGTLTDSMPVHFLAWQETMSRYGLVFPEAQFYAWGGKPTDKIIAELSQAAGIEVDVPRAAREKEAAFLERIHLLEPIPPVIEVAAHFRGRIPLAVASGGFRDVIAQQLAQIGCAGWFDVVVTAEDTQRHKPFPDVFLAAAARMGIPPCECLVYEDADLGLIAAREAGMDVIDVRTFHTPRRLVG
jgi:HAD superfamily hydrolase (TIGR01509 family)